MNEIKANNHPDLILDHTSKFSSGYIVQLFHQGIQVDDNSNPVADILHQARKTTESSIMSMDGKGRLLSEQVNLPIYKFIPQFSQNMHRKTSFSCQVFILLLLSPCELSEGSPHYVDEFYF